MQQNDSARLQPADDARDNFFRRGNLCVQSTRAPADDGPDVGIRQLTMVVKCLQCNEEICNRVLPGCTDDAGAKAGDAGTADAMRYLKDPHVCKRGAL